MSFERCPAAGIFACVGILAVAPADAERQTRDTERLSKSWKQTTAGDIQVIGSVSERELRYSLKEILTWAGRREVAEGDPARAARWRI